MQLNPIAADVFQLQGFPPNMVNVYLAEQLLIDGGTRFDAPAILHTLAGQQIRAHLLSHVHPDHQGASHALCTALHIPLWCGAADAPAMQAGEMDRQFTHPLHPIVWAINAFWTGPAHPVSRILHEGDQVGSFTVIESPGHTRGHLAFWREADRLLILGDAANNMNMLTALPGLHETPAIFTTDRAQSRASLRKLAALQPATICFGHGPVLRDGEAFAAWVAQLPN